MEMAGVPLGRGRCYLTPSERFSVEEVIVIARLNETASKLCMLYYTM